MPQLDDVGDRVRRRLPELLEEHGVPAASVAIAVGDETVATATGVLNRGTGVEATTDAIFQIGSVTKTWTATLALQLVDEGLLDLDAPVRTHLPGFRVADERASAAITARQLLCHVAGFEGDVFTDTGRGDDCVERYVGLLADTPQLFPPGELFSYNNAGFCVLGRLVEVLRGKPYDACLRDHLVAPLGLTHVACDPYDAVLFRTAVGHPTYEPTDVWALARSNAPAGSMLAMRATDLVAFARMHLRDGDGPGGSILSARCVAAMRARQVDQPPTGHGTGWGLGWELWELPTGRLVGHDGNTIGQSASLRIAPEHDLAVAVLSNGGDQRPLHDAVLSTVLRDLVGMELPPPVRPDPAVRVPRPDRIVGTYASVVGRTVVTADEHGRIWLERVPLGVLAEIGEPAYRTELVAGPDGTVLPVTGEGGVHAPLAFLGDDGHGRAAYLHTGRADRRVG
ncbi:serine hydrolase domain-containing protein [Nocardioides maradonensis]